MILNKSNADTSQESGRIHEHESEDSDENQKDSLPEDYNAESDEGTGNPSWADCIANVLNSDKPRTKKTLILSRAKKLNQIEQQKKSYDFEIDGEQERKEEKPDKNVLDEKLTIKKVKPEKKSLNLRIKPSIKDREREKALKKIATRGVVQLFNAVRIQQKEIEKELQEAGPLDHRKDAVLKNINKRKFLDVLMSGNRAKSENIDNPVKKDEDDNEMPSEEKPEWSVLRADFMTNKKLKHWDQESNSEDEAAKNNSTDDSD